MFILLTGYARPVSDLVNGQTSTLTRADGRTNNQLRSVRITRGFTSLPAGSVLVEFGNTKVLCTASVSEGVPGWKRDSGEGWLTAEYSMLPGATAERNKRESIKGHIGGRTHEISRLIGRSLRGCIDFVALGENTITLDCDVLQADGGTRTASITGAYVALVDAVNFLSAKGKIGEKNPIISQVAAVSVGIIDGQVRVDLPYEEDSRAEVDFNVVANEKGEFIEVQGTGEAGVYTRKQLDELLDAALGAIDELTALQRQVLGQ